MSAPAILVYDGDCSMCARWATRVERLASGRVRLADLRRADLPALDPRLTLERCERGLHLLEPDGRLSEGFDVFKRLSALVPRLRPLWPILRLPGASYLGPKLYEAVARARFRLSERLSGRR